ncbi:flagellar biosynthesis anti-sigma factor FlgM [Fulvimonas soli]|jgi:negative regulator of flagellin synthesis FlgM|uniref:Negative regulator of flagellin synthesis n=1 Tax=Fulvimonas soli TaxID=155197 RepID=A0A316HRN4_9GAMM|nr:flagellar biosynthesis anti-sigma factor FlgM [Fulvimonas soli]PWK83106.1 FlgM family anti-sigma-28 factor [Fulvimonas soli]TNY24980.1 flagellar biosynthesis anti-sigma factor FlgM [Fulvimonas soli]
MNTTIQNNGLPKLPQAPAGQGNAPAQQGNAAVGGSDGTGGAARTDDRVKLTDSARALQEAARTGDAAAIDSQKVEKIRQALADGSYQVNPARIADGMLALDAQLGGAKGTDKA